MSNRVTVFVEPLGGKGGPPRSMLHLVLLAPGPVHVFAPKGLCLEGARAAGVPTTPLPRHQHKHLKRKTLRAMLPSPVLQHRLRWVANGFSALWSAGALATVRREPLLFFYRDSAPPSRSQLLLLQILVRAGLKVHLCTPSEFALSIFPDRARFRSRSVVPNVIAPAEVVRTSTWPVQRLGWIGSKRKVKGLDLLLRILAAEGGELPCYLYGIRRRSPYIESCVQLAEQLGVEHRLVWRGREPESVIFSEIDVLISTSERESFGRAILRAAAHGVPVIAPAVAAIPDVFGGEALYPRDQPGSAVQLLQRLQTDHAFHEAQRAHGLQRAALYTPQAVGDRFLELLARM